MIKSLYSLLYNILYIKYTKPTYNHYKNIN